MNQSNLFIIALSKYELNGFTNALNLTVKDIAPIKKEEDIKHRANYTMSINTLNQFNEAIKQSDNVFPAILAFHSTLTGILPKKFQDLCDKGPGQLEYDIIENFSFIREIARQLNNQDPNAEGNILINDYLIKQKEHGTNS